PVTSKPALAQPTPIRDHSSVFTTRPKPIDHLAADKPGEELAPDAGIWQLYVDEAKEHDNELVESKNKNLDMMLLFATLFSAILTAFILDSKKLLQQDQADVMIMILLTLAQSQQRIEQGVPLVLPLVECPSFSAPLTARWVNGLWFTALALSLAAGLVAMLAKEWLTAFVASRPRPPRSYALTHQARLMGLKKWRTFHIIDLLPLVLHLSLLLFCLGLAIYLWTLDTAIAIADIVVGATVIFYLGTAVSAAMCDSCPFVTQISTYLNIMLRLLFWHSTVSENRTGTGNDMQPRNSTIDDELRTLSWLADNARDPAVSDCTYQAVAGLSLAVPEPSALQPDGIPAAKSNENSHSSVVNPNAQDGYVKGTQTETPHLSSNRYTLIHGLFDPVCVRLSEAKTLYRRELTACQGLNVARYCSALPEMVYYLWGAPRSNLKSDGTDVNAHQT
ncbi:hypothetical protein FRC06_004920, partial [Ceratobasidium sp. 370]